MGSADSAGSDEFSESLRNADAETLAGVFVDNAFLLGMVGPLRDRLWTIDHAESSAPDEFSKFMEIAFERELSPLSFLKNYLATPSRADLKRIESFSKRIAQEVKKSVERLDSVSYRAFAASGMQVMARMVNFESNLALGADTPEIKGLLENSLYRMFDDMDALLGIEYKRESELKTDIKPGERLYEGAGAGVQTSYASLLIALDKASPSQGARVMDLGSGYGRFGFVIGLSRPDISFTGYEFVPHRVEVAAKAAEALGLSDHVRFVAQDLSDRDFMIPEAEVYYMYDPFTPSTYRHVFQRLKEVAKKMEIVIITKGNAADRFIENMFDDSSWMARERYDAGTLSLFRSKLIK